MEPRGSVERGEGSDREPGSAEQSDVRTHPNAGREARPEPDGAIAHEARGPNEEQATRAGPRAPSAARGARRADENELLGEFILTGLRRASAGQVEVEVAFEINADGIVSVQAKDLETGKEQSITVTSTSGLTQDELDQMMTDARDYAVTQRAGEEIEKARQEAETLIAEIEKLFPKVEEVVAGSDFGRDAIEKARAVVARTAGGPLNVRGVALPGVNRSK